MQGLKKDVQEIKESQIRMEMDIKYHIKRTDTLESMTMPLYKLYIFSKYTLATLSVIGTILAIYFRLK